MPDKEFSLFPCSIWLQIFQLQNHIDIVKDPFFTEKNSLKDFFQLLLMVCLQWFWCVRTRDCVCVCALARVYAHTLGFRQKFAAKHKTV